jgi:transposase
MGPPERKEGAMAKEITVLGIDFGKNSYSLAGLDVSGAVVKPHRMRPEDIALFAVTLPRCVVAMEACCGAHHLGRLLMAQGHEVRLMSPEYVRPYVRAQKNDDRDAEAIAEAATSILLERGITVPQGRSKLERYLDEMFDGDDDTSLATMTARLRALIADMRVEWSELDRRIGAFEAEFVARAREDDAARRVLSTLMPVTKSHPGPGV